MSTTSTTEFTLGDYQVGRIIGEGTFGKVKLGVHGPTNQKVAVKTLQKEKISDQADIQRVTRQICILKMLHHPNIAQLYEIIETKTDIHLIMQYAQGGQLFDHIVKHRRIQQKEAVKYMQQLLAGIEYIHRNGVVHRDLKPQNLLFDEQGNIKIVDFGLSNQYKVGQKLKTACGSPCYAAPEMIAGKQYDCLAVDIWSSGIILYAMLCGYLPFEDPNTSKLYKKIIAGDFQLPKNISSASKNILRKILNTNPESRYSIEQIRSSEWYNQISKRYVAKGTIIGSNTLEVNQTVLSVMRGKGIDENIVRDYVRNNRHNRLTAYYYLMKKAIEKDPLIVKKMPSQLHQSRRSESPLIYRPDIRIPQAMVVHPREKSKSRDQSFNASSIINSLIEANRQKLSILHPVVRRNDAFQIVEDFKLFPKKTEVSVYHPSPQNHMPQNSHHNSSINQELLNSRRHQLSDIHHIEQRPRSSLSPHILRPSIRFVQTPTTPPPHLRQTLQCKQKHGNPSIKTKTAENILTESRQSEMTRRRQQLTEQLKLISCKIDNSINELKKRNDSTNSTTMTTPNREESGQSYHHNGRFKTQILFPTQVNIQYFGGNVDNHSASLVTGQILEGEVPSLSPICTPQSIIRIQENRIIKVPRPHIGPFNTQCLFHSDPKPLLDKIQVYLRREGVSYSLFDTYTIKISDILISIESLQGAQGHHLVQFSLSHPSNQKMIAFLQQ